MSPRRSGNKAIERPDNYLVWLEWPERCFCADAEALRYLKTLVPAGSEVVRVRSREAFLKKLPRATHAIVWSFESSWFDRAPRLRMLATPAAGQELVPTSGPDGVKIHFGHYHGQIMSETVAAFVLAWARGFFRPELKDARWPRTEISDKCYGVAGTRAVIVGYGHVGRAVGEKLSALGVETFGLTRHGIFRGSVRLRGVAVSRLLHEADWLVLALPSNTGTDDFLDAAMLRQLPRKCVVVNVGRGNAVDERALHAALVSHRIAGAYLDVRKCEPSSSAMDFGANVAGLDDLPNCIVMPHAAAFSPDYVKMCFRELKDDGFI